jgi:ubiquinone/menaquinone biosynthesis C-methylase UbiE
MATTAAEFWDQQEEDPRQVYWLFHPEVREYANQRMTGVSWGWPQLWLKSQFDVAYQPLEHGISIGCGVGHFERSLRNLEVVRRIDAYDVSPVSIQLARKHAIQARVRGIHFRVGDAERMLLPDRQYDFAAFSHSLHHITDPDALLEKLSRALKPGAILYVDDYVGPSRHEWIDEQLAASELRLAREEFDRTPDEIKLWPCNPPLDLADPSEMIRSDRIVPAIESRFDVIRYAPYWGNFLLPLLSAVDGRMLAPDQPNHGLLARWVQREKELVDAGAYRRPLFAFFVCRNR